MVVVNSTVEFHPLTTGPVEDLSVNLYPESTAREVMTTGSLIVDLEANPSRYDEAEVAEHHRQLVAMIGEVARAAVDTPEMLVDDLPLLVDEPASLLDSAEPLALSEILDRTVACYARRVAVGGGAFGRGDLTFGELDRLASEFAGELADLGARPGESVGVLLGRGVDQVVAWWAVARAGATVVLVDPEQPASRIEYVLGVVRPVVVVVGDGFEAGRVDLSACGGVALIRRSQARGTRPTGDRDEAAGTDRLDAGDRRSAGDASGGSAAEVSTRSSASASDRLDRREGGAERLDRRGDGRERRWPVPHVDDAAYIVFTSGTTGTPKGIAVSHRGLANLLRDAEKLLDDGSGEPGRLAGVASLAFDIAHFEMLVCAGLGYTLVPMPELGAGLGDRLVENDVTHLYATPSLIARIPVEQLPPTVCTIGEALPPAVATHVAEVSTLRSTYGPAEATLYATVAEIVPEELQDRPTPIGLPVDGMGAYVLDHKLRPLPSVILGELYLAGPQLARGYLGQAALTASRFVACPWDPGKRMYRTGDIVRVDPTSGLLEFHGRNDDQISVHGVRIEPAEIERLAAEVDGVDAAVAVPVQTAHGTSIEVAVTARDDVEAAALTAGVRHHLFATLPSVMWPRRVLVFDSLPLGSTGKLDRRAVAEQFATNPIETVGYRAPEIPMEQTVAQTVSTVLEVDDPSMLASVIDLGGTSLALMEIVGTLSTATGRRVRIADITVATTLGDIADPLDATPPATATAAGTDAERHLTRTQQELWQLHRLAPAIAAYHLPVHLTFDDDVTVADLTAALGDVVTRHEALRTVFPAAADVLAQLPVTTAALDDDAVHAAATAPFDLTADVPWRATLDDTADHLALVLTAHHIAVDATSVPILVADFLTALRARRDSHEPHWAAPPLPASVVVPSADSVVVCKLAGNLIGDHTHRGFGHTSAMDISKGSSGE